MSYDEQVCVSCGSENVFRVPSLPDRPKLAANKQVGQIVDKYIEDTKKEVKKEKLNRREL